MNNLELVAKLAPKVLEAHGGKTESQIIVKDMDFKRGCSLAIIGSFILYNIVNMMIDYDKIASSYPENDDDTNIDWKQHTMYFMKITISLYFWTFFYMLLSFVILFIFKILILNIIKFDSNIFKTIQKSATQGNPSDILFSLSKLADDRSSREITISDMWDMIFSFARYKDGISFLVKLFTMSILVAIVFAILVAPPKKMKSKKNRNTNIRLFLITLLFKMIFMFTIFIIVSNLLSI
jgi:hypothetical protein